MDRLSFVLLLFGVCAGSAYRIPSEDIVADVQINDMNNPRYFTYKVHIVLGNSEEFDLEGSTADGNRDLIVEPAVGGPKVRVVRQEVFNTVEGGKPVIRLAINSTVINAKRKLKYTGYTTITYKAFQDVQWFTDHEAKQVLNYKGEGCDPRDPECNPTTTTPQPRGDPCVRVVRGDVGLARPTTSRPQYSSSQSSGGKLSVVCQSEEYAAGSFRYTCTGVDPSLITISTEHILWLNGPNGCDQQLDIVIPNYRVEELIRAALKASSAGSTNINILLKKPETIYDVQAQDGGAVIASKPQVSLQYEAVDRPVSLHYPTDRKYDPLSGPIREPAGPYSN